MFRVAREADAVEIIEIMNQAIDDQKNAYLSAFDDESGRVWFESLFKKASSLLVVLMNDKICGWGSLTSYRESREALSKNVEITFYVHRDYRRMGVGSTLIEHLEKTALESDKKNAVAILLDDNIESEILLKKNGYKVLGHFPKVAYFTNKVCGHFYMWKVLAADQLQS